MRVRPHWPVGHAIRYAIGAGLASRASRYRRGVLRGGSWNNNPENARSANLKRNNPDNRNNNIGFRVLCSGGLTKSSRPERIENVAEGGDVRVQSKGMPRIGR